MFQQNEICKMNSCYIFPYILVHNLIAENLQGIQQEEHQKYFKYMLFVLILLSFCFGHH